jgi:hypothetical protein
MHHAAITATDAVVASMHAVVAGSAAMDATIVGSDCPTTSHSASSVIHFVDPCPIPMKERKNTRKRSKLPSHHLTGDAHINFIKAAINKKKPNMARKRGKVGA